MASACAKEELWLGVPVVCAVPSNDHNVTVDSFVWWSLQCNARCYTLMLRKKSKDGALGLVNHERAKHPQILRRILKIPSH